MDTNAILAAVKVDLGTKTDAYDDRLRTRITSAIAWIQAEGATLTDTEPDRELVAMYAVWLWRSRLTGEGMPRMLRYALNNRVLGEKARTGNAG